MNKKLLKVIAVCTTLLSTCMAEEESQKGLDGMFGVKFGTIMSEGMPCEINDSYSFVYEYEPLKQFKDFKLYRIFTSPKTRTAYQVRGVRECLNRSDAEDTVSEILPLFEMKYGSKPQKYDKDNYFIRFPNGDFILIIIKSDYSSSAIFIDAISSDYNDQNKIETKQYQTELLEADIARLRITPEAKIGEMKKITGVFGKKFGEKLPTTEEYKRNDNEALICQFTPGYQLNSQQGRVEQAKFLQFDNYMAFATPNSREIFYIRAVYQGNECSEVFDKTLTVLELATGKSASTNDDGDKILTLRGNNGSVSVIIQKTDDDIVFLDIVDMNLLEKANKEENDRKRQQYRSDMDAL